MQRVEESPFIFDDTVDALTTLFSVIGVLWCRSFAGKLLVRLAVALAPTLSQFELSPNRNAVIVAADEFTEALSVGAPDVDHG
ncbi:hypothetical protein [Halegenticoccus tardaugens]|uniref:hypothetical protein n=1 Tax=Halegenticoccus tardaugens TaxID=2071624 RepID=UPI00100ACF38|nr:hypothetical protein [Halegenticoccus tardaugens]